MFQAISAAAAGTPAAAAACCCCCLLLLLPLHLLLLLLLLSPTTEKSARSKTHGIATWSFLRMLSAVRLGLRLPFIPLVFGHLGARPRRAQQALKALRGPCGSMSYIALWLRQMPGMPSVTV
jgi:hypothetical protein